MKTVLVVDGYNAINAIAETKKALKDSLFSARSKIIIIAKEYARSSGYITDFCVVFDGQDRYRYLDKIDISKGKSQIFSDSGEGDDTIIDTVRNYSEKNRVVLASNDNYVRNNARGYGASLMHSEELVRKKVKGKSKKEKEDTSEEKIAPSLKDKITKEYGEELGI